MCLVSAFQGLAHRIEGLGYGREVFGAVKAGFFEMIKKTLDRLETRATTKERTNYLDGGGERVSSSTSATLLRTDVGHIHCGGLIISPHGEEQQRDQLEAVVQNVVHYVGSKEIRLAIRLQAVSQRKAHSVLTSVVF